MLFYTEQTDVFFDELDTNDRAIGRAEAIRKFGLIVHEDGSEELGDIYIGDYEVVKRMYREEKADVSIEDELIWGYLRPTPRAFIPGKSVRIFDVPDELIVRVNFVAWDTTRLMRRSGTFPHDHLTAVTFPVPVLTDYLDVYRWVAQNHNAQWYGIASDLTRWDAVVPYLLKEWQVHPPVDTTAPEPAPAE